MIRLKEPEKGFSLLEVSIALLIIGIMTVAAIRLYDAASKQQRLEETQRRMEVVVKALAEFVETSNRIPCPADPRVNDASFGWEWGVTEAQLRVVAQRPIGACDPVATPESREGLVPFQTLNIPFEMTKDGWGNYFTYAVSPVFTLQTDKASCPGPENPDRVHEKCREAGWIIGTSAVNAPKARFCCAQRPVGCLAPTNPNNYDADQDIRILLNTDGNQVISPQRANPTTQSDLGEEYAGNVNEMLEWGGNSGGAITRVPGTARVVITRPNFTRAGTSGTGETNATAVAFVLISHGMNGSGTFAGIPSTLRNPAPASGLEQENTDGDRDFGIGQATMSGANYFDDIVRWMTQDQLMAYNGASSCRYP
jgi:prepilin-type N-terminal cleavage/methylation domain-containing protein